MDRVPWYMLAWVMRRNGIPYVLVRSVISLVEDAKTRLRENSLLSQYFEV